RLAAGEQAVQRLARVCALRDQTCACKTAACLTEAATAEQALDAWFSENRRALDAQRTPAFDREWQATRREVAACKAAIGEQVGR
ncbi:MAG TPA: hypothetical protein PKA64_13190, partial [Myxococcota bacterium]|nr:hypothetical protein [Myxococcota bacterium]